MKCAQCGDEVAVNSDDTLCIDCRILVCGCWGAWRCRLCGMWHSPTTKECCCPPKVSGQEVNP